MLLQDVTSGQFLSPHVTARQPLYCTVLYCTARQPLSGASSPAGGHARLVPGNCITAPDQDDEDGGGLDVGDLEPVDVLGSPSDISHILASCGCGGCLVVDIS